MTSYPLISIIFPNYNGRDLTQKAVRSFLKSDYKKGKIEIIVVDNGSSDGSIKAITKLKSRTKNLILIRNKANEGFAKAINKGAKKAKGKYLFITNNDIMVPKNFFTKLISFVRTNNVNISGPDGYKYNLYTGLFRKAKKNEHPDWIPGYAMLIDRKLWKRLNGFDEKFFFTYEDLDLCKRAARIGDKILICPSIKIKHLDGATVNKKENLEFKYYWGYVGKIRFLLKHGNFIQVIISLLMQLFVYAPYRFVILNEKSFASLLRAFVWNISNLPR